MEKRKIGLFGGTFDPVHNGHLIIAEYLRDELKLDEVWFIPTKLHPFKSSQLISSDYDRMEMLKLAISSNPYFRTSDVEIKRPGVSYTIDTINELNQKYADQSAKFFFFMGMDNVNEFYRWKSPQQILEKCQVVAFGRPGFVPNKHAKPFLHYIQFIQVPLLEISATFIRQRVKEGRSIRYLVPDKVIDYIKKKQLYK